MRRISLSILAVVFLAACATQPKAGIAPSPAARPKAPAEKQPLKAAPGLLVCKGGNYTADFFGRENFKITAKAGEARELPAGEYNVAMFSWTAADAAGKNWTVQQSAGRATHVDIKSGQTTYLQAGPPFKLAMTVSRRPGAINFEPLIKGAGDEVYPIGGIRDASGRVPLPKVVIKDDAGKVLNEGAFRFG